MLTQVDVCVQVACHCIQRADSKVERIPAWKLRSPPPPPHTHTPHHAHTPHTLPPPHPSPYPTTTLPASPLPTALGDIDRVIHFQTPEAGLPPTFNFRFMPKNGKRYDLTTYNKSKYSIQMISSNCGKFIRFKKHAHLLTIFFVLEPSGARTCSTVSSPVHILHV